MKKGLLSFLLISIIQFSYAQAEKTTYQHFSKGKSFWGVGLSPVSTDMIGSFTDIQVTKSKTSLGILLAPMYGKFIQTNLMLGVLGLVGFHTEKTTYPSYSSSSSSSASVETINNNNSTDFGIAPIVRYYLPFNKRNSMAFFIQGALPGVYSKTSYKQSYKNASGSVVEQYKSQYDQFSLIGSIGFGLSVQGRLGSIDTHLSNMGWFLSFNKSITKK